MSVTLSTRPLPHLLANKEISYVLGIHAQIQMSIECVPSSHTSRYQPVKPLGKKRRRRALTNAERKLKKARSAGKSTEAAAPGEDAEEEEVEEPEEVELMEHEEIEEPESLEVRESLPRAAGKSKK